MGADQGRRPGKDKDPLDTVQRIPSATERGKVMSEYREGAPRVPGIRSPEALFRRTFFRQAIQDEIEVGFACNCDVEGPSLFVSKWDGHKDLLSFCCVAMSILIIITYV